MNSHVFHHISEQKMFRKYFQKLFQVTNLAGGLKMPVIFAFLWVWIWRIKNKVIRLSTASSSNWIGNRVDIDRDHWYIKPLYSQYVIVQMEEIKQENVRLWKSLEQPYRLMEDDRLKKRNARWQNYRRVLRPKICVCVLWVIYMHEYLPFQRVPKKKWHFRIYLIVLNRS